MGILDDAKETAKAAGEKIARTTEDTVDRVKDHADAAKAEAEVKKAEKERDSVEARNTVKKKLRDE